MERRPTAPCSYLICKGLIGGPDRDRTDDLFHAMEARSQLRHRPTLRKDSFYSGRPRVIRQRLGELICPVPVSNNSRVSEHSAAGGGLFFDSQLRKLNDLQHRSSSRNVEDT